MPKSRDAVPKRARPRGRAASAVMTETFVFGILNCLAIIERVVVHDIHSTAPIISTSIVPRNLCRFVAVRSLQHKRMLHNPEQTPFSVDCLASQSPSPSTTFASAVRAQNTRKRHNNQPASVIFIFISRKSYRHRLQLLSSAHSLWLRR